MLDSQNPYSTQQVAAEIRPRLLIRFLGGLLGTIVCLPTIIFPFVFFSDPVGFVRSMDWTFAQVVGLQLLLIWLTYRWLTIQAKLDEKNIQLRGWVRSLKIDLADFGGIQKIYYDAYSTKIGHHQKWHYIAFDRNLERIGKVPGSMLFCKDWEGFMDRLNSFANPS